MKGTTNNRHGLEPRGTVNGDPANKYSKWKAIEKAESFKELKKDVSCYLIYLMVKACDLLEIPETMDVSVILSELYARNLLTDEEYNQTISLLRFRIQGLQVEARESVTKANF